MSGGKVLHVCISSRKGIAKHEIPAAKLIAGHGMEADAHAGDWHRQVSLLAHRDIESMRAKGLRLKPGAFGENLVVDNVDIDELGVGSLIRIGSVLLELTQVGKVCHTRCAIYFSTGDCIMPRTGLFARVLQGGEVGPGMAVEIVQRIERSMLQAGVIIVSDRCSIRQMVDTVAPAVADLLRTERAVRVAWTRLLPHEGKKIADAIRDLCERRVDLVLTVGGAGPQVKDVTPEATREVIERELPRFGEAMRAAFAQHTRNWLSRAVAGMLGETLIVNLLGSAKEAVENLRAILPTIPHAVKMLRNESAHPETDAERLVEIQTTDSSDTPPTVEAR